MRWRVCMAIEHTHPISFKPANTIERHEKISGNRHAVCIDPRDINSDNSNELCITRDHMESTIS